MRSQRAIDVAVSFAIQMLSATRVRQNEKVVVGCVAICEQRFWKTNRQRRRKP
jgi:hypothetical protein